MTAQAIVSAAPSPIAWQAATVKNYTLEPARPIAVYLGAGGSITFTDGAVPITVAVNGQHFISPLNVTAVTAPAFVMFQ
jgi:hypothetical protein